MAVDYFQNLFSSLAQSNLFEEGLITYKLSGNEVEELNKPFTKEEIKKAMKQMHPQKSPGLDGI